MRTAFYLQNKTKQKNKNRNFATKDIQLCVKPEMLRKFYKIQTKHNLDMYRAVRRFKA